MRKKYESFFASLKSMKKGVGSGVVPDPHPLVRGTDPDPDPHQNVMDPQNCSEHNVIQTRRLASA